MTSTDHLTHDHPSYPTVQQQTFLSSLPFDHQIVFQNQRNEELFNRLRLERGVVESGELVNPTGRPWCMGVVICEADVLDSTLITQILALACQSYPVTAVALFATTPQDQAKLGLWAKVCAPGDGFAEAPKSLSAWMEEQAPDILLVLPQGCLPHPSLAMAVVRSLHMEGADLLAWHHLVLKQSQESQQVFFQRSPEPAKAPLALAHFEALGRSWGIRSDLLKDSSLDIDDCFYDQRRRLVLMEALQFPDCITVCLNEFLVSDVRRKTLAGLPSLSSKENEAFQKFYAQSPFLWSLTKENKARLTPKSRASSIDAVICFRDLPEQTICAARSVLAQKTDARLSVYLINNQSTDQSRAMIEDFCTREGQGRMCCLEYNLPFSHSAQTNLGIAAGSGEVILIMSNDCQLIDADVLDELAAWALCPGIGVVAPRIEDQNGQLTNSSLAPLYQEQDFFPPVTEGFDHFLAQTVHEAFATSFACSVVSRQTFQSNGLLAHVRFPVGLNDLEMCLRLSKAGLHHLYVGTKVARHTTHGSRRPCHDGAQAAVLRRLYPGLWMGKDLNIEFDSQRQQQAAELQQAFFTRAPIKTEPPI